MNVTMNTLLPEFIYCLHRYSLITDLIAAVAEPPRLKCQLIHSNEDGQFDSSKKRYIYEYGYFLARGTTRKAKSAQELEHCFPLLLLQRRRQLRINLPSSHTCHWVVGRSSCARKQRETRTTKTFCRTAIVLPITKRPLLRRTTTRRLCD